MVSWTGTLSGDELKLKRELAGGGMMGGGKLVLGSRGRTIGAGHFGLIDEG